MQEDGRTGKPLDAVPDAPWISKGAGRWGGAAQARTLGLARATGTLLRRVDDLLPDQGWHGLVTARRDHPRAAQGQPARKKPESRRPGFGPCPGEERVQPAFGSWPTSRVSSSTICAWFRSIFCPSPSMRPSSRSTF